MTFFENNGSFTRQNIFFQLVRVLFPKILLASPPHLWKIKRKYLSESFKKPCLKSFEEIVNRESKFILNTIEEKVDKGFFDIRKVIEKHVCFITLEFYTQCYDRDYLFSQIEDVLELLKVSQNLSEKLVKYPFLLIPYLSLLTKEGYDYANRRKLLKKKFEKLIQNMDCSTDVKDNVVITQIHKIKHHDKHYNDDDICDEILGLVVPGYETVSFTIIVTLFYLGLHNETQSKVRKEVNKIFDERENKITNQQDVAKMILLDGVINEVMRLHPPVNFFGVTSESGFDVNGQKFPEGTNVIIPLTIIHRNEEYFTNSNQFKPERFWNAKASDFDAAFMPFGRGSRFCIGFRFGLLETKVILANIIHEYVFETIGHQQSFKIKTMLGSMVDSEIYIKFSKIQ
ncbi:Cytochrome P450 4C1-like protein [Leptotrombidium deliense]|uniref:Cytochrome P450 4C1-like protein n=1 Tax=Leptotrombidium deliense TaxID=299467 RepID=A0A443S4F7_9ACAR|nr:Cytochrome P450 4C1-like protein [Leptotrombidium deliense]